MVLPVAFTEASLCLHYEIIMDVRTADIVASVCVVVADHIDASFQGIGQVLLTTMVYNFVNSGLIGRWVFAEIRRFNMYSWIYKYFLISNLDNM